MSQASPRLPVREKFAYSLGDIATNFFFQSMILYQTRFYTDTVGISAAAVGTMFLVLRLADAFFDPIIGALADRTNTRWGKFRPWIIGTALPFGVIFWLVYVAPDFGPAGRLVYAYITYTLIMLVYSANNTPYAALMGVMTPDQSERSSVASYRFVAALVGQFVIQALPLPLVAKLGGGNDARGWAITMAIFGGLIVVLNIFTFLGTKERLQPIAQQKTSIKSDIRDVINCRPWIYMFVLTLMVFTMLVVRGSSLNYLMAYYMDQQAIRSFFEGMGLTRGTEAVTGFRTVLDAFGILVQPDGSNAAAVGLSFFMVMGSIIQIGGIIASKPLAERFGKKAVFITGVVVTIVATVSVIFVGPKDMSLMFWLSILWPLAWGPTVPLLWVMIADVADYSEWQTGRRATGFMFAGIIFALKAGLSLGGALSAWLPNLYGYVPNAVQTEHALLGIRLSATVFAAVPIAVALVCLILYPINKQLNLRIGVELADRRKKQASAG